MKHTIKDWFITTRFWSFPVSAMPVLTATVFLFWKGYDIRWGCAALALVGNVLFHAAGNLLSDWWDYRKGVDNEKAYAIPQLVFHQFEPKEYLTFSAILFSVAVAVGLVLTYMCGWELLVIGIIGALLAANYSFFKFRALGDIFVFTCFGVLPVLGTSFVAAGQIDWSALVISIPLGILTIGVLHDNNTVDIATDREAGIKTLPMLFGERTSVRIYIAYIIIPFVAVAISCVTGFLPYFALSSLLALPAAIGNVKAAAAYSTKGREAMLGLDQKTAQLHMIFSLLLSAGLLIAGLV